MSGGEGVAGEGDGDRKDVIRSLIKSIHVIQAINLHGALSLTDIARGVGVPFPTAYRIVNTLLREGLIEREEGRKRYRPTALIQTLACGFQNHDHLVNVARPAAIAFTDRYHWPLTVVTRVGDKMVVRYSTNDRTTLTFNNYYPGWQVPLLASASGQVYLSYASETVQQSLLDQSQAQGGEDNYLLRQFRDGSAGQRIRTAGHAAVAKTLYSANPGRTSSIAVPLFNGEELVGSLAMVFFASAMSLDKAVADYLAPLKEVAEHIDAGLRGDAVHP
ncbi:helix-turn-helix domain-containing protein [Croceibacterium ferulae]|uniref:helix-turn-helix domain-containing protein n=1 Tax=Croceibacterium ferulae TaxID=1854641 RepID=UPI00138FE378|nr:helix-turn-helix domain-containing protein [Croceibacterium ferulae]